MYSQINLPTVIVSVALSVITAYFFTNYLLNKFLIKLEDIDKKYRIKMIHAIIDIVNNRVNKDN